MYPGTIFNWYDQSEITEEPVIAQLDNSPLFAVVSSFDKGPEELMEVKGEDFYSYFGNKNQILFEKHGQNAIQAARIIDAGGRLLIKRVVADDAKLANLILIANLSTTETQKTDEEGNPLYYDDDGNETTEVTDNPVMEKETVIKWEASSVENVSTFEEVEDAALDLLDADNGVFPVLIFTDNGRGVSNKAIRIIPDYNTSKGIGQTFYTAAVFEGTTRTESTVIGFDPDMMYSTVAYGLDKDMMVQLKGETIPSVYEAYLDAISEALDVDPEEMRGNDLIFGYSYKGSTIDGLTVDEESLDLNCDYGIELQYGDNGEFGDAPVGTDAWTEAMRRVWAGEVTDEIWDVDQHKVCAVCDANLPQVVKDAIADWVMFREDCMFFRDLGLDLTTITAITNAAETVCEKKSRFIADYLTSYTVKDPATKKNIKVTMMYDFAACLVDHFDGGAQNPLAGIINSFILRDPIKGTLNYTPIVTPTLNQKQVIDDLRLNYAIFEDDNCIVQSLYTSQELNSQLSYANNVLAIQEVARAVRTACPQNRYSLVTGSDMTSYAKAVNNVLQGFASNFDVLEFDYTRDDVKSSQHIFYATIKFAFHMWAQTEIFDLFAITNS